MMDSNPTPTMDDFGHGEGRTRSQPRVVGIGVSTGGPEALAMLLPALPASFPLPILIVQHMLHGFTASLIGWLAQLAHLPVLEARHGDVVGPGKIWIAPAGRHLLVRAVGDQVHLRLTDDPPENSCRPSVDCLFRSLASVYGDATIALIMTGMGQDGFQGMQQLHQRGAYLLAQDASSCKVFGMPRGPIEAGIVHRIAPLTELATCLETAARPGVRCS